MPRAAKLDRDTLLRQLEKVGTRLLKLAGKDDGAAGTVKLAQCWIQHWTVRAMLANLDLDSADKDLVNAARYESRKCSDAAAEWSRRQSDAERNLIQSKQEEIDRKIEALLGASSELDDLETG